MQLLESYLEPDILAAQLAGRPLGGARSQPERRLQTAVLADAILTFQRWAGTEGRRPRRLFAEVDSWFGSDDADGPFTFLTICDSLGFDPAYVRRGLRDWCMHVAASAHGRRPARPAGSRIRHQAVVPRLRRVA